MLTFAPLLAALAVAVPAEGGDKTLSPYLYVQSADPSADRVPLKETRAEIDVAGVIAHVKVKQVYQNEGSRPLEAIYVFPGSTRSAVFAMRMKIGERTIVAKIEKKEAARQIYERAKEEGKTASLLEQHRPNVFQMNVANILPGDRIEVELDYTELIVPEAGVYELVYPTVVGPRYNAGGGEKQGDQWTANPYTNKDAPPMHKWGLATRIRAGMGIHALQSPSHKISPRFGGPDNVALEMDEPEGGNRDFVLRYRLTGDAIQTGLLLMPGEKESFFLMMVQPPKRVEPSFVPPREYIFVLDVSGSMHGFPLEITKNLMREIFRGLRSQDRFNVMLFSGGSSVLAEESLPATQANLQRAMTIIEQQRGGGGTEILGAIRKTLALPRAEGMSTSIVVATDGYVVVERETFAEISKNLGTANLFAFGIGSSVNRYIIDGMAHAGMGEPYVVLNPNQAEDMATKLKRAIESPVLTDVRVLFDGFETYDVEPPALHDVFGERPVVVFGKYKGSPKGKIRLTGKTGRGDFVNEIDVASVKADPANVALRYLWARHRIGRLSDFAGLGKTGLAGGGAFDVANEVTELGLKYSLMTEYTSFVAVDDQARNAGGGQTTVKVPLPLPQGVEQSALGHNGYANAAPPVTAGPSRRTRSSAPIAGKGLLGAPSAPAPSPSYPMNLQPSADAADLGGAAGVGRGGGYRAAETKRDESGAKDKETPRASAEIGGNQLGAPHLTVLRRHLAAIRRVYEQQVLKDPSLADGKVVVELKIGADGKVTAVKVVSSTFNKAELERQIQEVLRRIRFRAGEGDVTLQVPLHFRR